MYIKMSKFDSKIKILSNSKKKKHTHDMSNQIKSILFDFEIVFLQK